MKLARLNDFLGHFGLVLILGIKTDSMGRYYHGDTEIELIGVKSMYKYRMHENPKEAPLAN